MDAPKAGVALHHGQHHDERSNGGEAAGCIACNQERVLNYQAVKDPGEGGQDNEGCCRSQGDERGWSCWELPILSPYSPPSPSANTWERIERAQVTDPLAREHGRKRGCVEGVGGEDAGNGSTDAEQVDSHPSSRKQPEVLAAATQIRASADLGSIPLKYPPVHRRAPMDESAEASPSVTPPSPPTDLAKVRSTLTNPSAQPQHSFSGGAIPLFVSQVRAEIARRLVDPSHDDGSLAPLLIRHAWHQLR